MGRVAGTHGLGTQALRRRGDPPITSVIPVMADPAVSVWPAIVAFNEVRKSCASAFQWTCPGVPAGTLRAYPVEHVPLCSAREHASITALLALTDLRDTLMTGMTAGFAVVMAVVMALP